MWRPLAVLSLFGLACTPSPAPGVLATPLAEPPPAPDDPAPAEPPGAEAPRGEPAAANVLWLGGDMLLSGAIRRAARREGDPASGFAEILRPALELRSPDDHVVVNLETPIARRARYANDHYAELRAEGLNPTPINAPRWLAAGLRAAGVDAVTVANNHALDQGREGLAETLEELRRVGLRWAGAELPAPHTGALVLPPPTPGAPPITLLTYLERDFPEPGSLEAQRLFGVSVLDPERATVEVAAAEGAVVVVIHVVAELFPHPKPRWERLSRRLVDAGASTVLFHGQHVPGPVQTLRVGPRVAWVAYGLGNFFSDMGFGSTPSRRGSRESKWEEASTREGLLARIEARSAEDVSVTFLPLFTDSSRWLDRLVGRRQPPNFSLRRLGACADSEPSHPGWDLASLPGSRRAEAARFLERRRGHLLRVSRLVPPPRCPPGVLWSPSLDRATVRFSP